MKLISMTDFVLQEKEQLKEKLISGPYDRTDLPRSYDRISNYAEFLKQPLALGMLIPENESGDVLKEPIEKDFYYHDSTLNHVDFSAEVERFTIAKEKVLFKGILKINKEPYKSTKRHIIDLVSGEKFMRIYTELTYWTGEVDKQYFGGKNLKVEDLIKFDLILTPSALEAIGIKQE